MADVRVVATKDYLRAYESQFNELWVMSYGVRLGRNAGVTSVGDTITSYEFIVYELRVTIYVLGFHE